MSKCKRLICFAFPVALVMALVLGLAFMHIGSVGEVAFARSKVYVGSGSTYNLGSGTISGDIDVAGGTLNMTGGTITGSINLNGTMKINSSAVINGTVNYQNTSSYITLTSSLTRTISVKTSSTASGTRVAYSATASYLNTSRFSVTNLPSTMKLVIESNYIVIRPNTFTVTIIAGSGGTVNSTSSITLNNVAAGTAITESSNTLKIGETTITATANSGYKFSNWSYSSVPLTGSMAVTGNMTIYAFFSQTSHTVRFSAGSGGSVSRSSISGVPDGAQITVSGNTITINGVTVTATANSGYKFSRWVYSGTTVTGDMTITAEFTESTPTPPDPPQPTNGGVLQHIHDRGYIVVGTFDGHDTLSDYERYLMYCYYFVAVMGGSADDIGSYTYVELVDYVDGYAGGESGVFVFYPVLASDMSSAANEVESMIRSGVIDFYKPQKSVYYEYSYLDLLLDGYELYELYGDNIIKTDILKPAVICRAEDYVMYGGDIGNTADQGLVVAFYAMNESIYANWTSSMGYAVLRMFTYEEWEDAIGLLQACDIDLLFVPEFYLYKFRDSAELDSHGLMIWPIDNYDVKVNFYLYTINIDPDYEGYTVQSIYDIVHSIIFG